MRIVQKYYLTLDTSMINSNSSLISLLEICRDTRICLLVIFKILLCTNSIVLTAFFGNSSLNV